MQKQFWLSSKGMAVLLTISMLSGCQHIQLARSPLPITLHPVASQQTQSLQANTTLPQKNKPPKPSAIEHSRQVYLLENWF